MDVMKRNNKGITLIALVITIIVMLILVGVTISMSVNGGLFTYAGRAASETNKAIEDEKTMLDLEENLTPEQLTFKFETLGYTVTVYGDTNLDGVANLIDSTVIKKYLEGILEYELSPQAKLNGDVNLDGVLDMNDAAIIKSYELGAITELPYTGEIPE